MPPSPAVVTDERLSEIADLFGEAVNGIPESVKPLGFKKMERDFDMCLWRKKDA